MKRRSLEISVWKMDNPEKMYDERIRRQKKRQDPEWKLRRREYDKRKRDEKNSKRIIIEPLD